MPMMNLQMTPATQEEKQEFQALIDSGLLSRAPNLQHFLEYVCERYFAGEVEGLKEYSIAVNALHRPTSFNPQIDTIVRVTAHALRKRLEQFYAGEGAGHEIHIVLPSGQYLPRFDRNAEYERVNETVTTASPHLDVRPAAMAAVAEAPTLTEQITSAPAEYIATAVAEHTPSAAAEQDYRVVPPASTPVSSLAEHADSVVPMQRVSSKSATHWLLGAAFAGVVCAGVGGLIYKSRGASKPVTAPALVAAQTPFPPLGGTDAIRFLPGEQRPAVTDAAQQVWQADRYCTGGRSFSRPDHKIEGTEDSALFTGGREGKFQCRIPVSQGLYEVHLYFADTAEERIAMRQVVYYINGGSAKALDVTDEASGSDIAVEKIYTGVQASSDGTIHLDFTADGSFINAIELIPAPSTQMLPWRMTAATSITRDSNNQTWAPETFFFGGRRSYHPDLPHVQNASLYQWERFGHFRYVIPVVPGKTYTVNLHFSEGWFGAPNGSPATAGSRVFDVFCNGTTLLNGFDISAQQKNGIVIRSFHKVTPTSEGKLELSFVPVTNYPLVNAVEVIQE